MAAPVIDPTQSVLGCLQGEETDFQPYASNNPTRWETSPLAAGLAFNTGTGLISGAPIFSGVYNFALTAINAEGRSTPLVFTLGVEHAALSRGGEIEITIDAETGAVSIGVMAAKAGDPLFTLKENDQVIFFVVFKKRGVVVDHGDLEELNIIAKQFEPDPYLTGGNKFVKSGVGALTHYKLYVKVSGSGVAAAEADSENDAGTFFDALWAFEWVAPLASPPAGFPASLRRESRTFIARIERDLTPADFEGASLP
jgi:hypothetical protein